VGFLLIAAGVTDTRIVDEYGWGTREDESPEVLAIWRISLWP